MKGMISVTCHTCHTAFPLNLLIRIQCKPADVSSYDAQGSISVRVVHSICIPFNTHSRCVNVFIVYDIFDRCSLLEKYKCHHHMSKMLYNCHLLLCCRSTKCQNHMLLHLFSECTVWSGATKVKKHADHIKDLTIYSKIWKTWVLRVINWIPKSRPFLHSKHSFKKNNNFEIAEWEQSDKKLKFNSAHSFWCVVIVWSIHRAQIVTAKLQ